MKVRILGKNWNLRFTPLSGNQGGDCDAPHIPGKTIRVNSKLSGEKLLETILHECRHAADWGQSEEYVTEEARDIARILWRLGYRRQ